MSTTTKHHAWVYIMASRASGTVYIGVTTDLRSRVWQHKTGACDGFTKRYRVNRLVYFEQFQGIRAAIGREKVLKGWTRPRKISLLEATIPAWVDLAARVV